MSCNWTDDGDTGLYNTECGGTVEKKYIIPGRWSGICPGCGEHVTLVISSPFALEDAFEAGKMAWQQGLHIEDNPFPSSEDGDMGDRNERSEWSAGYRVMDRAEENRIRGNDNEQ